LSSREKAASHVASISDSAVLAKTGKVWSEWFAVLDRADACRLDHKGIVRLLVKSHGVPSWWRQMIAVEYERARGLRVAHETATGFSVAVSATVPTGISRLYAAAASPAARQVWFPRGEFRESSATTNKYLRGSWNRGARLEMNFYAKGDAKAQLAVQISKLAGAAEVEAERAQWKAALATLKGRLAG
jgi:hypothetical protein